MSWCSRAISTICSQHLARVERAGGVVRVDDDDRLGAVAHLGAHVVEVGVPVRLLVADVVNGPAAGKRDARRPQRVVGGRDEHLVAVVEQGRHAQVDELADAVARVDVVDRDVGYVLELGVLHDGLAGREKPLRVGVALAVGQLAPHVVDDLVGRAETERGGVADVELEDVLAVLLHARRLVHDRAADVVQDVVELRGLLELAHGASPLCVGALRPIVFRRQPQPCVGAHVLRRGRLRACASAHEPFLADAQLLRQKAQRIGTRDRLARHILADVALSQLHALGLGRPDQVDLLEVQTLHRLLETGRERVLCHDPPPGRISSGL